MLIVPRPMPPEQTASWLGLLDLHERLAEGWTLIGGQLIHLHCAECGQFPVRPTNDADTVIDVRADTTMLATFTKALTDLGFESAGISAEGLQHRGNPMRLQRSETIAVMVAGREGSVRRPNLVGALVAKAAAHTNQGDRGLGRHRRDFVILTPAVDGA
jgi:hypothetical protein